MPVVSENKKPIANPLLVLREEFDDWAVLFDPDTGDAFGLNPTSVFIWKQLDGHNTPHDILNILSEHCENVPDDAANHLNKFLEALIEKGFVGYEVSQN
ncbi:MAG: SynChlorMet cassette protein ScmD [bacterium]